MLHICLDLIYISLNILLSSSVALMKSKNLNNDDTLSNFAQEYINSMSDMDKRSPGRYSER